MAQNCDTRMINLLFMLLLNILSEKTVFALLLTKPFDHDIYSGRHFNELVFKNGKATQSAVLVMYKPSCDSKLQEYKLSENLPPDYYIAFLKYDYEFTPKYSWYHFDGDDDLYKRYEPKACLELLYFPVGSSIDNPQRSHAHSGKKISESVWKLVKVSFSIRNLYGRDIMVRLEVKKKVVSSVVLKPTHEEEATAYATHNLFVLDARTGKLIYATVVDLSMDGTELAIDKYIAMDMDEDEWRRKVRKDLEANNEKTVHRIHNTARRYLLDMKQPSVIPTFTEEGYSKQQMPPFLLKEMQKFYEKERESLGPEDLKKAKKEPLRIELSTEIATKSDLVLKILIEEWADTTLQLTKSRPIVEYQNGSVVYGHLGNVASQVIGVVMVLKKELGNGTDWPFEVIGHDGIRKNLTLETGDMILYESATCLLGNPYPFQGESFVTTTIFYRPDDGWKWAISGDHKNIIYGNEVKESVNIFATTNLLDRSKLKSTRDEL